MDVETEREELMVSEFLASAGVRMKLSFDEKRSIRGIDLKGEIGSHFRI